MDFSWNTVERKQSYCNEFRFNTDIYHRTAVLVSLTYEHDDGLLAKKQQRRSND